MAIFQKKNWFYLQPSSRSTSKSRRRARQRSVQPCTVDTRARPSRPCCPPSRSTRQPVPWWAAERASWAAWARPIPWPKRPLDHPTDPVPPDPPDRLSIRHHLTPYYSPIEAKFVFLLFLYLYICCVQYQSLHSGNTLARGRVDDTSPVCPRRVLVLVKVGILRYLYSQPRYTLIQPDFIMFLLFSPPLRLFFVYILLIARTHTISVISSTRQLFAPFCALPLLIIHSIRNEYVNCRWRPLSRLSRYHFAPFSSITLLWSNVPSALAQTSVYTIFPIFQVPTSPSVLIEITSPTIS